MNHIFYFEDEPDIQEVARLSLEAIGGFRVDTASTGAEGLAKLETIVPDAILLDVMMPGMDGPTVLRELRKNPRTAAIPVIFMTAKVQTSEIERYKGLGALDVIPKPFDPVTLADEVRAILGRGAVPASPGVRA